MTHREAMSWSTKPSCLTRPVASRVKTATSARKYGPGFYLSINDVRLACRHHDGTSARGATGHASRVVGIEYGPWVARHPRIVAQVHAVRFAHYLTPASSTRVTIVASMLGTKPSKIAARTIAQSCCFLTPTPGGNHSLAFTRYASLTTSEGGSYLLS